MITTSVILAAGLGSRLRPYTDHHPKGFISLHGQPIVVASIKKLLAVGMTRIIIGTGYMKGHYEELQTKYTEIECVENSEFSENYIGIRDIIDESEREFKNKEDLTDF